MHSQIHTYAHINKHVHTQTPCTNAQATSHADTAYLPPQCAVYFDLRLLSNGARVVYQHVCIDKNMKIRRFAWKINMCVRVCACVCVCA